MVISLIALFVALGGTGYAIHKVGANDLKPGAVRAQALGPISVRTESIAVPEGQFRQLTRRCEGGERLISGGGFWADDAPASNTPLMESSPIGGAAGWTVRGFNGTDSVKTLFVSLVCLRK
jgi:hypothetical protein